MGLHDRKEEVVEALRGLEGAERSSLQWILFRLILMHRCRSTTRATKNWTIRAFLLLEAVVCLWG